jgi:hypothetical protein
MERDTTVGQPGDDKNALPREVDDHPDSWMPRQLRTQADNEPPLSRAEADVAGISPTPQVVYGETDGDENRDDQRDAHHAEADEHI